jgi:histidinol-phosphate phosphatase family protein
VTEPVTETVIRYSVVIPTTGRDSLRPLLHALATADGPAPAEVLVVDDRPAPRSQAAAEIRVPGTAGFRVLRSGGRGPAAARNTGWRATTAEWVVFLDDDVRIRRDWPHRLAADLARLPGRAGGSQGRIRVPLPAGRRPTDAERNVASLATARWITADMAYRRAALAAAGGFDERFTRAYREDADLALRVRAAGYQLTAGSRLTEHPVRPGGFWDSVRAQAGNADDALMGRLHGHRWRRRAGAGRGRLPLHAATVAAGAAAIGAIGAAGLPARWRNGLAASAAACWLALTVNFLTARVAPGPASSREWLRMAVTSVLIPPAAVAHRFRGEWRYRGQRANFAAERLPAAVLFDRDGTLIRDVPYNGDPERVEPVPVARAAVDRVRRAGVPVAVVTNQSGVARGWISSEDVDRVNKRAEEVLGPFDAWAVCPHAEADGCRCRKPAPGLIEQAAGQLGVPPARCVVIGDIAADVVAAEAAGARGILVPTPRTRPDEVESCAVCHIEVAPDLRRAVDLALGGRS